MSQYDKEFVKLHKLLERKLGDLKETYKITTEGIPSAYEVFNSPKVEDRLKQDKRDCNPLTPGHIDSNALEARFEAAFGITQNDYLQNSDPAFCRHVQSALQASNEILGDKQKEAAYAQWLRSKQQRQPDDEQDKARQRQRQAREKTQEQTDGEQDKVQQPRDRALQRLRHQEEQKRKSNANKRQKEFTDQQSRRKDVEKAVRDKMASKKSGFLSRVGAALAKAPCALGSHKGEWFYEDKDACHSILTCERCGQVVADVKHSWQEPHRLIDKECEFVQFCSRCGEEAIGFQHNWRWNYINTDNCEQQPKCTHCHETSPERREMHDWGQWSDSGFNHAWVRACKRCGKKEIKENYLEQESQLLPS